MMIRTNSRIMQMAATEGLITNIIAPLPIIPKTDVHHEKQRNVGLNQRREMSQCLLLYVFIHVKNPCTYVILSYFSCIFRFTNTEKRAIKVSLTVTCIHYSYKKINTVFNFLSQYICRYTRNLFFSQKVSQKSHTLIQVWILDVKLLLFQCPPQRPYFHVSFIFLQQRRQLKGKTKNRVTKKSRYSLLLQVAKKRQLNNQRIQFSNSDN